MCSAQGAGVAAQSAGAAYGTINDFYSAHAQKRDLNHQAEIATMNARLAEMAAQQELVKGERAYQASKLQTAALKGKQKVAFAANGFDLTQGTPQQISDATDYMGELDANTIQANTIQSAFGYRTQAVNLENQARQQRAGAKSISPLINAGTGLLTRGSQVAQSWYKYDQTVNGTPPQKKGEK